jgi:hypothetical protein
MVTARVPGSVNIGSSFRATSVAGGHTPVRDSKESLVSDTMADGE